jgi:3-dehydroquinate synthase
MQELMIDMLEALGLPTRLPQPKRIDRLMDAMIFDKKVAGDHVRLILLKRIGEAEIVEDVPAEAVAAAWRAIGAVDG